MLCTSVEALPTFYSVVTEILLPLHISRDHTCFPAIVCACIYQPEPNYFGAASVSKSRALNLLLKLLPLMIGSGRLSREEERLDRG